MGLSRDQKLSAMQHDITKLTQDELKALRAQINFLLDDEQDTDQYLDDEEILLYNEMVKVLRAKKVRHIQEHEGKSRKPRLRGFKLDQFRKGYTAVQQFLTDYAPDIPAPLRVRFYSILADSLGCYIMGRGETIGIKNMLKYLEDVEEVFEDGFPGYLRNNLLIEVLRIEGERKA